MHVCVLMGGGGQETGSRRKEGWYSLRPEEDERQLRSRLMDLVEHQLSWDTSLWAVEFTGAALERSHVLLHNLVKEHGGQLGVQQRAELEGNLSETRDVFYSD